VRQRPRPAVLAIDIPIGLPDAGARDCDRAARARLGRPRASSVFPAPPRATLAASTYVDACRIGEGIDGRRLCQQAWAIVPKIREVDQVLRCEPGLQMWVREVHPEVSFAAWRNGRPMKHSKRRVAGRQERRALVEATYGSLEPWVQALPRRNAGIDDLLDACAALWTAERIARGMALVLPAPPATDSFGLRMEIVV
jgi:predicted RNase H-like nuclease